MPAWLQLYLMISLAFAFFILPGAARDLQLRQLAEIDPLRCAALVLGIVLFWPAWLFTR